MKEFINMHLVVPCKIHEPDLKLIEIRESKMLVLYKNLSLNLLRIVIEEF